MKPQVIPQLLADWDARNTLRADARARQKADGQEIADRIPFTWQFHPATPTAVQVCAPEHDGRQGLWTRMLVRTWRAVVR